MSSRAFIGIDFGTSTSSVAWLNQKTGQAEVLLNAEGEPRTPSVVYYGEHTVIVGKHAEQMLEDDQEWPRVVPSVKRDIASASVIALPGRRVKPVQVATEIFAKLERDAEDLHFHEVVERAVVTVPAAFSAAQRDKIKEAATTAASRKWNC